MIMAKILAENDVNLADKNERRGPGLRNVSITAQKININAS